MNARDELLAALTAERYDNRWWVTRKADGEEFASFDDHDLATARRRRDVLNSVALHPDEEAS